MIKKNSSSYEENMIYLNRLYWRANYKGSSEASFMLEALSTRTGERILDWSGIREDYGFKGLQNMINKEDDWRASRLAHNMYKMNGDE